MKTSTIILFIFAAAIGFLARQLFFGDDFNLLKNGETREETIIIKDGEVVGTKEEVSNNFY